MESNIALFKYLDTVPKERLVDISDYINKRLHDIQEKADLDLVLKEIHIKGIYMSLDEIFFLEEHDYMKFDTIRVPVEIRIDSKDPEREQKAKVIGWANWDQEILSRYLPDEAKLTGLKTTDWDYDSLTGDWDEPWSGIGSIQVYVYYLSIESYFKLYPNKICLAFDTVKDEVSAITKNGNVLYFYHLDDDDSMDLDGPNGIPRNYIELLDINKLIPYKSINCGDRSPESSDLYIINYYYHGKL